MKTLNNYIIEKFKINANNSKGASKYNPDELNNENAVLYDSEDEGEEDGDNDVFFDDMKNNLDELDDKYQYFISLKFKPLSKIKDSNELFKSIHGLIPDDDSLKSMITDNIIDGRDLGYEVKLVGGHIEVHCINSGSRGIYYIYALNKDIYEKISDWYSNFEESNYDPIHDLFIDGNIIELE